MNEQTYRERMAGVLEDRLIQHRTKQAVAAYEPLNPADACGKDKAPAGWRCTRLRGHEGPCAAVRVAPPWWRRATWYLKFPLTVRRFERVFNAQGEPFVDRWVLAFRMARPTVRSRS